jgi:aldehyde:ferredoxin oxidoreductase
MRGARLGATHSGAAERFIVLARMFRVRQGMKRQGDVFLRRRYGPPPGGATINREDFQAAIDSDYEITRWDEGGVPGKGRFWTRTWSGWPHKPNRIKGVNLRMKPAWRLKWT